jgi:bacterioferritin
MVGPILDCYFNCEEFNEFRVDKPYPLVDIKQPNSFYARMLMPAYSGRTSEMTSTMQYIFHKFYLNEHPDILNAYNYIALVEYTHRNILGNIIHELGVKPIFAVDSQYWSGEFPNYATNLVDILETDIQTEIEAIAEYERIIKNLDDESINNMLRRIILDEQVHMDILTKFLNQIK